MARPVRATALAALMGVALSGPLLAAQAPNAELENPPPADVRPPGGCSHDLMSFDGQLAKDGYWRSSEGYGFGFPIGDAGLGLGGANAAEDRPVLAGPGYYAARPGQEVRVLLNAANILARLGNDSPAKTCWRRRARSTRAT